MLFRSLITLADIMGFYIIDEADIETHGCGSLGKYNLCLLYTSIEWSQIQFPIDLNGDVLKQIKPIETNQSAVEIAKNIIAVSYTHLDVYKRQL